MSVKTEPKKTKPIETKETVPKELEVLIFNSHNENHSFAILTITDVINGLLKVKAPNFKYDDIQGSQALLRDKNNELNIIAGEIGYIHIPKSKSIPIDGTIMKLKPGQMVWIKPSTGEIIEKKVVFEIAE